MIPPLQMISLEDTSVMGYKSLLAFTTTQSKLEIDTYSVVVGDTDAYHVALADAIHVQLL